MAKRSFFLYLAIAVAIVWSLFPIYWFCRMAFLTPDQIRLFPQPFLPGVFELGAFYNIFGYDYTYAAGFSTGASGQSNQIIRGVFNGLFISGVVTVITLIIVLPLAYVFARMDFRHKEKLLFAVLLSVALPPVSTLIPFYSMYVQLGLTGTRFGLILVTLTITVPFVAWMLIGYFRNVPPIERLARIDGYSRMSCFLTLILPLSKSGIAVAAVIAFLFSWNEYTYALVLVNGTSANTLPPAISGFLAQYPEPGNLAASIIVTIIPPALFAFFLQRHVTEMSLVDPVR
ncbi:MAG TPA: carbohydrate ABC transporter permease [Geminicoccus sp.]|jgi:multiple sugar transport system permease protein|uniref:carbohydrate ABC transporter permease n=1 Tax=Geminicoccus sp. TaxID=2024832 RepID=UPI002E371145|nr:carbohydrate ABC transporter permease [Geminicoccus sp.]HEX2526065.1 carbohydrate ABC transporter permease [Geminicoccus sp.]